MLHISRGAETRKCWWHLQSSTMDMPREFSVPPGHQHQQVPTAALGYPWGKRRKRMGWKKSGIKRKMNWALKWKGKPDTVVRVFFHSMLLHGWDPYMGSPSLSAQSQIYSMLSRYVKSDPVPGKSERETYPAQGWEQMRGAGGRATCSSFAAGTPV